MDMAHDRSCGCKRVTGSISSGGGLSGTISSGGGLSGSVTSTHYSVEIYDGSYEFIPTEHEQVVSISGKKANHDIVIAPIPQNYGRIAWDGSTLTVW